MNPRAQYAVGFLLLALLLAGGLAVLREASRAPAPTAPDTSGGAPERGGSLVATVRTEPRTFNRYAARDSTSDLVSLLLNAKLVRINRVTDTLEPWLAERWSASDDGLTYTLTLRDARFSDGTPFTSADVVFAFEAVYDPATGSPIGDALRVGGKPLTVSAPDARTVAITFPSPFGPGLRLLDGLPILPRHRLEQALRSGTLKDAWGVTTAPAEIAGLGPFVLREYVPGQRLVFGRNTHYWRRDKDGTPLPYIDRLTLEIVPDQAGEMLRLESGQADLTQSEIRPEDYAALKRSADAGRLRLIDLGVGVDFPSFLWFNLKPEAKAKDPRRHWLQHADLRRAISHAVDRQAFADAVYRGAAVPVHGPVTPGNRVWYSSDTPTYPYDPERAKALLGTLGLTDRNGDGIAEDPSGHPAAFSLITQKGNTARERSAAVLQEDLRKIGLRVDIAALEFGALIDRITRADYDAVYFGPQASDTDPANNLDFWRSTGTFHFWNANQPRPATEWERRIDELMERQIATTDAAERHRLFAEVQRIFAAELPAIAFAAPRIIVAMSTRVTNATPALLRPQVLWNPDVLAVVPAASSSRSDR